MKLKIKLRPVIYPHDSRWWVCLAISTALVLWLFCSTGAYSLPRFYYPAETAGALTGLVLATLGLIWGLADDFFSFSRWVGRGLKRLTKDVTEAEEGRWPAEPEDLTK